MDIHGHTRKLPTLESKLLISVHNYNMEYYSVKYEIKKIRTAQLTQIIFPLQYFGQLAIGGGNDLTLKFDWIHHNGNDTYGNHTGKDTYGNHTGNTTYGNHSTASFMNESLLQ